MLGRSALSCAPPGLACSGERWSAEVEVEVVSNVHCWVERCGPRGTWHGGTTSPWWWAAWGVLLVVLTLGVTAIIAVARRAGPGIPPPPPQPDRTAEEVLRRRHAAGELEEAEFDRLFGRSRRS